MKQPELGRKIFDLRTEKGLTQEELVEKCNISVRTIQRIENGEVSPRSYTIKSILVALDYDLNKLSNEDSSFIDSFISWFKHLMLIDIDVEKSSYFLIKQLNIAWMFGILYFSTGLFESASEYFLFTEDKLIFSKGVFITIKIVALISFVFFQRGFVLIGGLFRNYLLKIISLVMIIAIIPLYIFDIILIFNDSIDRVFIAVASALTFGFVGLIIYIPAELFEIILIFKVIEIIKNKQTENISTE